MRRISSGACSSGRRSPSRGRAQVLTDRGRWILAFGGGVYLAAWGFGSLVLYPIALGLVLAVAAAALWVRFLAKPMRLSRILADGEHYSGDDISVRLEMDVDGWMPSGALVVRERIAHLGARETDRVNRRRRLRGTYLLDAVPRGRYPIEAVTAGVGGPFAPAGPGNGPPARELPLRYSP